MLQPVQMTHFSKLSDLWGLCTKASNVSSLLLDNCDMPERLEEDMSSFERFPFSFPAALVFFLWDIVLYLKR